MNLRNLMLAALVSVLAGLSAAGCKSNNTSTPTSKPAGGVVLYTSVDDPYVRPLTERFQKLTGVRVTLVTDAEMSKTAGLAEKIEAEAGNPRADVYWGNEIFHTINLADKGVFAPYRSPAGESVPERWRGKGDLYTSIGLRARVIVVSARPEHAALVERIKGVNDLADAQLKGKIAMCNPAFGTTSGHVAALRQALGDEKFNQLLAGLRANDIKLLGGNSAVVDQVASGALVAGLTDTDDVRNAQANGEKVALVLPDQDGIGTLLMPTTVALVKGGPNAENGKKLIDFLLSPEIEKELIDGRYLAYSTRDADSKVKAMNVDYAQAGRQMRPAVEAAMKILQGRSGEK